jgi:predicted transcriptional regulator
MNTTALVAARFDGEIVVLDPGRAALVLLDEWSAKVWEACNGQSLAELSKAVGGSRLRLRRALGHLSTQGLIRQERDGWTKVAARDA